MLIQFAASALSGSPQYGVPTTLPAVMAGLGGTVHSSLISGVPLAQHIGAFFVLRWCSRSGTENMTRDSTPPPGPADLPAAAIVGGARCAYESRPGGVVSGESVGDVGRQAAALTAG